MKNPHCLHAFYTAALVFLMSPSSSQAVIAYTIQNKTTLLRFDTATPGTVTTIGNFSGAVSALDGLDFRPSNGLLYGYSSALNAVVTIDLSNGSTTSASTPSTASSSNILGIDFNPVADRLRLVNGSDQNLRINVATGVATVDVALAYAAGDPNVGSNPTINEAAYTNNDNNTATGTLVYYLDHALDTLVTTSNPNGGVLNTVGALGVSSSSLIGFDIFTDPLASTNSAFAILDTGGTNSGFYSINLSTGAATLIGSVGGATPSGLAIQPVPEPSTTLFGLIALCLGGMIRRRSSRV